MIKINITLLKLVKCFEQNLKMSNDVTQGLNDLFYFHNKCYDSIFIKSSNIKDRQLVFEKKTIKTKI